MSVRRKITIIGGFAVAFGFIGYGLWGSAADSDRYDFVVVSRGDVKQEVLVTGRAQSAENVALAFERSGKVASVAVDVGDRVSAGQVLVALASADVSAQLAQAGAGIESARASLLQYQAALAREEARLHELESGTRLEEVALAETRVESAKKALADAERNVEQTTNKAAIDLVNAYETIRDLLREAFVTADDAVSRQTNQLFEDDTSPSPRLTFVTIHSNTRLEAQLQRTNANRALQDLKELQVVESLSLSPLEEALRNVRERLAAVAEFLQSANDALLDSAGLTSATLETYRSNVTSGLSGVNGVLASLNLQEQKIAAQKVTSQNSLVAAEAGVNQARSALATAEAELTVKRSPASAQEIAAQRAAVKQAEANIASQQARIREAQASAAVIRAQLDETVIRSPFVGTVTKQEAKLGEIVAPNAPLVELISDAKLEIEANVPEVDIAKLAAGQPARVTLDAYGSDVAFMATVVAIEPAETIVEGVATYKTKLQFESEDGRIKSGMTANVTIFTDERKGVILIPQRTVLEKDGQKIVRLLTGEGNAQTAIETLVAIGLRGSDGNVEITEGLREGDRVVAGEKEK